MVGELHETGPAVPAFALGLLMPMSIWVSPSGHIQSSGPTITKIAGVPLAGRRFLELFGVTRPRQVDSVAELCGLSGARLNLTLHGAVPISLRGVAVDLGAGRGLIVNLSFGIFAPQAVRDLQLSGVDFAPTDLTVELLYLNEIKAAVTGELAALNRRLQDSHRDAERQALTDALTGLANRRAFDEALRRSVASADRNRPFALMVLDLDRFKSINDTYGHAAGDRVLASVAETLRAELRAADTIARVGGDEFAIIMSGPGKDEALMALGARIISEIERPIAFEGVRLSVSASIGVARCRAGSGRCRSDRIQANADAALYASKNAGRAQCTLMDGEAV